ncbi:MAG: hypothetical protein R2825_02845 [Saprospiraceae bacterium]
MNIQCAVENFPGNSIAVPSDYIKIRCALIYCAKLSYLNDVFVLAIFIGSSPRSNDAAVGYDINRHPIAVLHGVFFDILSIGSLAKCTFEMVTVGADFSVVSCEAGFSLLH